jgi:outer membrane protein TolC
MVGKMERMVEMQETMILPGFSLGLSPSSTDLVSSVGVAGMDGGGAAVPTPSTSASVGAGLPKNPLYGTGDAYVRELRQRLEAQKEELRMEEAATALAVRTARFALDRAVREEALYADRLVTLSRSALESSMRGYSAGKVMFSDVLESCMGWLEANIARARGRSDVGAAWAGLEAAVGVSLPAQGEPAAVSGETGRTGEGGGRR